MSTAPTLHGTTLSSTTPAASTPAASTPAASTPAGPRRLRRATATAIAVTGLVTGLSVALSAPARAASASSAPASTAPSSVTSSSVTDGPRVTGTWNVRATPGGTLAGKVGPGPVAIDCQAAGPSVTIPGLGTSAVWDHLPGRGYVTGLALTGATGIPACASTPAVPGPPATPAAPATPAPVTGARSIVGLAGKCLTVHGGERKNGTAVELRDCDNSAAQRWTAAGGTTSGGPLRALGKCLDTAGQATTSGTRAQLNACDGSATQVWQLTGTTLRNTAAARCLDVARANPANGTRTSLRKCNGRPNQIWSAGSTAAKGPAGYGADILAQAGSWKLDAAGGQCKVWAAKVVNAVLQQKSAGRIGGYESRNGAYWGPSAAAGGVRVTAAQAAPGDLIQLNNPADRTSNVHYTAMHSAIIVARTSTPGTFLVRDSNWHGDERVTEHVWTPDNTAARHTLETNYWRFGTR